MYICLCACVLEFFLCGLSLWTLVVWCKWMNEYCARHKCIVGYGLIVSPVGIRQYAWNGHSNIYRVQSSAGSLYPCDSSWLKFVWQCGMQLQTKLTFFSELNLMLLIILWSTLYISTCLQCWRCWLGGRKGTRPVKNWWGAGVVIWWRGWWKWVNVMVNSKVVSGSGISLAVCTLLQKSFLHHIKIRCLSTTENTPIVLVIQLWSIIITIYDAIFWRLLFLFVWFVPIFCLYANNRTYKQQTILAKSY